MKIKFLVSRGHSIRETARLTGHARNTVRGVLRGKTEEGTGTETRGRRSKLADFKDYLRERYLKTGLSGTRLAEEIRQMGFVGSVSAVRRFLQTVDREEISPKATVRFETPPGEQAQVDWAEIGYFLDEYGVRRKIYAFLMVLSFSLSVCRVRDGHLMRDADRVSSKGVCLFRRIHEADTLRQYEAGSA